MKEFSYMLLTSPIYWIFIVEGLLLIIISKKIHKTKAGKAREQGEDVAQKIAGIRNEKHI